MMRKVMKILLCLAFVALFTATVAAEPAPQADESLSAAGTGNGRVYNEAAGETESAIYIIQLADEPVATYTGGVAGLAATSPLATGARKLDAQSPASLAYEQYLAGKQDQFVSAMNNLLGRSVDISFYYRHAYNGVAAFLSPAEAAQVAGMNGVNLLYREGIEEILTDAGPAFIGAETIWNASGGNKGEGIIVGIIDTGINSLHPSFADVGGDGYNHTNPFGSGNYVGYCVATPGFCNDKLIGAWALHPSSTNPEDADGHGSHTASTVAGNYLEDPVLQAPTASYTFASVSGVAPHANIIAYQVCVPSCPTSSTTAAVNQAVIDGVDVTNYSISGGTNPYVETTAVAFRNAVAAGVFPANSAGNSGPGAGTVGHQGPWIMTVAASTHNRAVLNSVVDLNNSSGPLPDILGESAAAGYGPNTLVYAGDAPYNNPLCNPFAAGTFSGQIVVCDRGTIGRVEKGQNVLNAGGGGMILANDVNSAASLNADTHVLPATHISYADGVALKAWMAAGTGDVGRITGGAVDYDAAYGDNMASFSSRGPAGGSVPGLANLIKPDVTAPGLNILAAYRAGFSTPPEFNIISGTSMSSPHAAGAAALIRAMHPTWTPAEVKSALMMTGITALEKENNSTPADPFDLGAGRVNLTAAGDVGFVLNITDAEYVAANPATGGDPKLLNLPSLANNACAGTCTWTRTLRSVLSTDQEYNASVSGPAGITGTVTPSNFTLAAGGTQVITVELDVTGAALGSWAFAQVNIQPVVAVAPEDVNDFDGDFDIANWTLVNDPAGVNGSFNTNPGPPIELFVVGGNSSTGGNTDFQIAIPQDGTISFNWGYQSTDIQQWDSGGVVLNGSYTVLAYNESQIPYFNGSYSLAVSTGDTFAFRVNTVDGQFGAGTLGVTNFNFQPGGGGGVPAAHMPVAVIPQAAPGPDIDIDPTSLSSTQGTDTIVTQTLTINNVGTDPLNWTIDEFGGSFLRRPLVTAADTAVPQVAYTPQGNNQFSANTGSAATGSSANTLAAPQSPFLVITHSASQAIVSGNSVSCNAGGLHADNSYYRAFDLPSFGVAGAFDISSVDVGVELANGATGSQPATLRLYAAPSGTAFPGSFPGSFTQIANVPVVVANQTLTVLNIPVVTTVPANSLLVVEFFTPSGQASNNSFFVGSNAAGQTAPSYIAAAACGIANPTNLASIGFPNMHIVMNVTGDPAGGSGCGTPSDIPWVSVSPTSGTTAPGGSDIVDVTFDSTGLTEGVYQGNLCINSDDPTTPEVIVPLTLEVLGELPPSIEVSPTALTSTLVQGGSSTVDLSISNTGEADLIWDIYEDDGASLLLGGDWADDFDSYPTGQDLHGVGGWKGWDNSPLWTAFTTDVEALSAPNSVDIVADADLVHEYTGATSGQWTYTAWQYIPSSMTGLSYFIMLNTYNDGGAKNWSVQVNFDAGSGTVTNDGASGGTLALVADQWVEIRVEIDLDANTQDFYYNNQLLYSGTWTEENSGGGALNIGAVDLFANGASSVYYDDMSLVGPPPLPCEVPSDMPWLSVTPTSGTTAGGGTDIVGVTFDATGLDAGVYNGTLCVASNDPVTGLVEVPVTLTVTEFVPEYGVAVTAEDDALSGNAGTTVIYMLTITNTGNVTDTFDVVVSGETWTTTPMDTSITLGAGASGTVMVHVDISATAANGDTDAATVTVTSQSDATATDAVTLTTTAVVTDTMNYIYLPIILKP